jgi:DNA adenine methylase
MTEKSVEPAKVFAQPFVKWLGGKRQILQQILPLLPERIGTYYEPFAGGAALFFALHARQAFQRAHLNDLNADLIAAFRVIQTDVDALVAGLKQMPPDRDLFNELRLTPGTTDLEKASRLMYLTRLSFNGLYRVNSKGEFNAPWGKYTNPRICDEGNLRRVHDTLQGVKLTDVDYSVAVESAGEGDFVYFDPPYVPLTPTSNFTGYTSQGFGVYAHIALAQKFWELQAKGVHVLLSNSDTPFVRSLYAGAEITPVQARRNINSAVEYW